MYFFVFDNNDEQTAEFSKQQRIKK